MKRFVIIFVVCFVVGGLAALGIVMLRRAGPFGSRPLFHHLGYHDMGGRAWLRDVPLHDGHGTFGWEDRHLNFLVVISTGESRIDGYFNEYDSDVTKFFVGAPYETVVHEAANKLRIVVWREGVATTGSFQLAPGAAERIYEAVNPREPTPSILGSLLDLYEGSDESELAEFLQSMREEG
ncbi:MAG: hypothetical protein ABIG44_16820 [Planctomycetota bacterium]